MWSHFSYPLAEHQRLNLTDFSSGTALVRTSHGPCIATRPWTAEARPEGAEGTHTKTSAPKERKKNNIIYNPDYKPVDKYTKYRSCNDTKGTKKGDRSGRCKPLGYCFRVIPSYFAFSALMAAALPTTRS